MPRWINWVYTYNHLDGKPMPKGLALVRSKVLPGLNIPFRVYDDDDVLYFTGFMTMAIYNGGEDEAFEPLDYGMAGWGTTRMDVRGRMEAGKGYQQV